MTAKKSRVEELESFIASDDFEKFSQFEQMKAHVELRELNAARTQEELPDHLKAKPDRFRSK